MRLRARHRARYSPRIRNRTRLEGSILKQSYPSELGINFGMRPTHFETSRRLIGLSSDAIYISPLLETKARMISRVAVNTHPLTFRR